MRFDREMNGVSLTRHRAKLGAFMVSLGLLVGAPAVFAQTPLADGQVIKIDQAAGKITIKHGPLKQFDIGRGHDHGLSRRRSGDAARREARR
jgi:hypothetical protein